MIFAQLNYKEINNTNSNLSTEKWCKMVNRNVSYCRNWTKKKQELFQLKLESKEINPIDLPSFHPYWKNKVIEKLKESLIRLKELQKECKKHPEKYKYYFNETANDYVVKLKIKELKENIKNYKDVKTR